MVCFVAHTVLQVVRHVIVSFIVVASLVFISVIPNGTVCILTLDGMFCGSYDVAAGTSHYRFFHE